ncbi:putative sensory transduction regulator [Krasilnikovia cinnamomea]|uniref:Putative sensory transduction regulator n=1 Tax=Krasilnikovia cinnamomea TaxID=349313 RepID=A0A4Q7ZP59_9ACTN|nr:YbjN domain-containing protein [Krasilnikovia cinnamomea]RZU52491.1 putative sensory transduction regulator [Krasilnikovia cinnamomea]
MPWWSWRPGSTGTSRPRTGGEVALQSNPRAAVPAQREPGQSGPAADLSTIDQPDHVAPVTLERIGKSLDLLDIRFLADGGGSLLAMWERHAVLFTLEGPDDEILVMRARPHATVPPDWADRAYRVVNEWNHTRRFCKAYVGDPTERGQLPIYAELQVPLNSGAHDALLVEMLDCGAAVATSFVDWLHDEGALL